MKNYKIIALALICLVAASCSKKASIQGTIQDAPETNIVVKLLNVNNYIVLDTLTTDKEGKFSYKLEVEETQPEFVYLFHEDTKLASLLLQEGDAVTVNADKYGNYTVEGSPESDKLRIVEGNFANFMAEFNELDDVTASTALYVKYYREAVKYVMGNMSSLTVVPVLFQNVTSELPIFGQQTDALLFRSVCDSLKEVYPESKYVVALEKETKRREQYLELSSRINDAQEVGFLDINLPGIDGKKVALSSIDAKLILLYFWSSSQADQKMFNLDFIKPLYERYHKDGLEIYAVCVDTDKASWASIVKSQELPWINVNDGLGTSSPALAAYNVDRVPSLFMIEDGELVKNNVASNEAEFRRDLERRLR